MWSATQIPHILRFALAATTGVPESKIRVIAPDVGGGFGGKLQQTPEEMITFAVARRLGKPVKYTETRSESLMAAHHGRDQWQKLTLARREGRHGHRPQGRAARRPRRLRLASSAAACRCSARSCSTRSTSSPPTSSTARRSSPTRPGPTPTAAPAGPEATYAIERMMDELAAELGRRPVRDPREELDHARGVPLHHGRRPGVRHRQLRGRDREGQGQLRLRRAAGRAEAAPRRRRPGPARHRRLDLHRDVRPGAQPGARQPQLRRRRLGARERADAGHRQGRGRHRRLRPRPGPRDGVQPDRRRPARGGLRRRRGPARRHADLPQGPRHLRLALAGRRRRGPRPGGRQGHREGQADRGPPARGLGRRHRVRRRPLRRQRHRPGPGHGRDRDGDLRRAQPARRHRAQPRQRRDLRPGQLQLPPRHAPVRDGGRHRDRRRADAQVHLRRRHRRGSSTR